MSDLQEDDWKLSTTNEFVSDEVSPLSLLSSTEIPSSTSSSPYLTDNEITYKLSYPETPPSNQLIETTKEKDDDGYDTGRYHDHIIASNDSIECIKPENVSILWATTQLKKTYIDNTKKSNDEITEKKPSYQRKKYKRTSTSYDLQTSLYLKSVFFEVYSKQTKLTKKQRVEVQEKTGLPSRNITYWFSNHKRRFKDTLEVYRKTVKESHGLIQNYKDFIRWRRSHDLPDEIGQEELI